MKIVSIILAGLAALYVHTEALAAPALSALDIDHALHAPLPKNIETVVHKKEANGGYKKGSPLFNKQEGLEKKAKSASTDSHPAAIKKTEASITPGTEPAHSRMSFVSTLVSVSVYAVLVLAFAYGYQKYAGPGALKGEQAKIGHTPQDLPAWTRCGFTYSFFDLGNLDSDWPICLTSYCCPIVQWATTASNSSQPKAFMSYWKAVALLLTLVVLAPFTYGLTGLVIMFIFLKRRRELRKAFNHTHAESRSLAEDVCLTFCCNSFLCCQLVQEAREVDYTSPNHCVV